MDDSILTRGLYQDDVIYADDENLYRGKYTAMRSDRVSLTPDMKKCGKSLLRNRKPTCTAFLGRE